MNVRAGEPWDTDPAASGYETVRAGSTKISAAFTQIYDAGSEQANTANTPYDKLDILYVAFAHMDQSTFKLDFEDVAEGGKAAEKRRLDRILELTQPLRAQGKLKVVISLGYGPQFNDIPLIEQNLEIFAPSVREFVEANGLDGFDIDYETPTFSSNEQFRRVSAAIRQALGRDYLFTITPNNRKKLDGKGLNKYYDYANVQSYDVPPNARCPVTWFTGMPGLSRRKIAVGADVANIEALEPIGNAIKKYNRHKLGGVFAWQITEDFTSTADQMWSATH